MDINQLLKLAVEKGASDLHLKAGSYPMARIHGQLAPVHDGAQARSRGSRGDGRSRASGALRQRFKDALEVDLAYSVPGLGRFRCNVFQQRGTIGMVLRVIPLAIRSIDELGLPPVLQRSRRRRARPGPRHRHDRQRQEHDARGDDRPHQPHARRRNIITIEDPIEYLHRDNHSIINQREIGADTKSFAAALRSALRQDPDVILVGEMRDMETIETALHAAETGHLVFSTLHTLDATETINRIISVFPPHQQKQIRIQLCQRAQGGHRAAPDPERRRRAAVCPPSRCSSAPRSSRTASSTRTRRT